jgi:uncharacterized protein (TIGR02246 family)
MTAPANAPSSAAPTTAAEPGTRVVSPQDARAIEATIEQFLSAWNQHDPVKMAACWAPDGDLINPMGKLARGRDQVERLFREEHQGAMKNSRHHIKIGALRFANPDLALLDGECDLQGVRDPAGNETSMHPHLFLVLTRKAGEWKVLVGRPCIYPKQP